MQSDRPQGQATDLTSEQSDRTPVVGQPWLPKFGIAEMMLAMMIFCVMAAAGSYWRSAAMSNEGSGRAVFVIFTLCSPVALVMVMSAYVGLKRWLRHHR